MRKIITAFLVLCILCVTAHTLAESARITMPEASYEDLFEDPVCCLTAKALRQWFITEGCIRNNRLSQYESIWNHDEVILCDPFIIRTETDEDGTVSTVYCFSSINTYTLCTDGNTAWLAAEENEANGLFRIDFDGFDDYYELTEVHRVSGMDEELFPGAGLGADGYPGLSDELNSMIPSSYWGTDRTAQRYADINHLDVTIINRAELP